MANKVSFAAFKKLHITFNPFHPNNKLVRTLIVTSASPKWKAKNPKLQVVVDTKKEMISPRLALTMLNGEELVYDDTSKWTFGTFLKDLEWRTIEFSEDDFAADFDENKSDPEGDDMYYGPDPPMRR